MGGLQDRQRKMIMKISVWRGIICLLLIETILRSFSLVVTNGTRGSPRQQPAGSQPGQRVARQLDVHGPGVRGPGGNTVASFRASSKHKLSLRGYHWTLLQKMLHVPNKVLHNKSVWTFRKLRNGHLN